MKFAELCNNILALSVIFGEGNEEVILDFLNCFKVNGNKFVKTTIIDSPPPFQFIDFVGSNSEHRIIYAYDEKSNEHIFEIHLLHKYENMPYNEIRLSSNNYSNKKINCLKNGKNYESISIIAIFNYRIQNENNYLSQRRYILGKPFNELRLNFIYLDNMSEITLNSTDLENWIYLFKKSHELSKVPSFYKKTVFEKALRALEIKKWDRYYRYEYRTSEKLAEHRKESNYRVLNLILYKDYFDDLSIFEKECNEVRLNYKLLEKELGFYPKVYLDKECIDLLKLNENIEELALNLFKNWKIKASNKFKHFNFDINDEKVIISNVKDDLKESILDLLTENEKFLRGTYSYQYYVAYVWGYLKGKLNYLWNHEYIAKKTDDYKKFSAIKAIYDYLKVDKVKNKQLNKLYESYLVLNSNIKNTDFTIAETDLREGKLVELERTGNYGSLMTILNNIIDDFVIKITKEEFGDFLDDPLPRKYEKFIEKVIKENEINISNLQ